MDTISSNQAFSSAYPPRPAVPVSQPLNYNFTSTGQAVAPATPLSGRRRSRAISGLIKLLIIILIPMILTIGVGTFFIAQGNEFSYQQARKVVLSVPMHNVNWQDLGTVFEPLVTLPLKTQTGYEEWEFLLDSGAVVSSLPREWAEKMGKDLAMMQRSTFRGFGGVTSFAYQGEMQVMLGDNEHIIPVVFTEAGGTKSLLGRKGFFEQYSVYFNHKERRIEIRE